jgi:AcrR family transcriptional regulator
LVPEKSSVVRRGDQLREHILWVAKDVFLEMGFERASMDVIADRAETSKRTLYAHFENKEKLYFAVVDLVRGLFLHKLKTPGDYPGSAAEALVMFCGRYLEILLFAPMIRMCRMSIAETERFAQGSARSFDVLFSAPLEQLGAYLKATFGLTAKQSTEAAQQLLGRVVYPRFQRALFGLDELSGELDNDAIKASFDLKPIRKAVADLIESLTRR